MPSRPYTERFFISTFCYKSDGEDWALTWDSLSHGKEINSPSIFISLRRLNKGEAAI
jgi:hypothetical protein